MSGKLARADLPLTGIVVWNVLPLLGVFLWGWNPAVLFLLYWLEAGVIGAVNVPKIFLANRRRDGRETPRPSDVRLWPDGPAFGFGNWTWVLLFLVHYGVFWAVFGGVIVDRFVEIPAGGLVAIVPGSALLVVGAMVGSHLVSLGVDFVGREEYRVVGPRHQMLRPYKRVVVLFVVIFATGFFADVLLGTDSVLLLAVVLVATKTVADVYGARIEREDLDEIYEVEDEPPSGGLDGRLPEWSARPRLRELLIARTPFVLLLSGGIALLYGTIIAVVVYNLTGGDVRVPAIVLLWVVSAAYGYALLSVRYGNVEYRLYPDELAVYDLRHGTVHRSIGYDEITEAELLDWWPLSRRLGVGTVLLRREGDESDVHLRALGDAERTLERIERRIQPEAATERRHAADAE